MSMMFQEAIGLIFNPLFLGVTLVGNLVVVIAALLFFHFEQGINPAVHSLFDAFYWAITTVTTVGYGDILPLSIGGRLAAMGLMILGTGLFLAYIAMFSNIFIKLELAEIEREVRRIESPDATPPTAEQQ